LQTPYQTVPVRLLMHPIGKESPMKLEFLEGS